jgi:hypothetical protein
MVQPQNIQNRCSSIKIMFLLTYNSELFLSNSLRSVILLNVSYKIQIALGSWSLFFAATVGSRHYVTPGLMIRFYDNTRIRNFIRAHKKRNGLPWVDFHDTHNHSVIFLGISYVNFIQIRRKIWKIGQKVIWFSIVYLSLHQFLRNSQFSQPHSSDLLYTFLNRSTNKRI